MSTDRFSALFRRLARDQALRQRFTTDPVGVLREEGYDPSLFDLPSRIDPEAFDRKIAELIAGAAPSAPPLDPAEVRQLNADELWSHFGVILEKSDEAQAVVATQVSNTAVAPAIVVYGTAAATSTSTIVTIGSDGLSYEKGQVLRKLAKLNKEDLRFTVTGPDGVAVRELSAAAAMALIRQVRKS